MTMACLDSAIHMRACRRAIKGFAMLGNLLQTDIELLPDPAHSLQRCGQHATRIAQRSSNKGWCATFRLCRSSRTPVDEALARDHQVGVQQTARSTLLHVRKQPQCKTVQ